MDAQEELAFLRSVAASQLQTIKTLTLGCEKYGLTETTPVVRHLAAQDDEIERLRAELAKADGQINRCVDQNKYLERLLAEAQRDVSIVTFLRCGGWEVLQNPKYWTPENKFFGAIAEAMADVAMEGK